MLAPKPGYRVLVVTNPALQEVASVPSMLLVESADAGRLHFYATFRKDFDVLALEWAVRLYLIN